jgi:hypothetical protein
VRYRDDSRSGHAAEDRSPLARPRVEGDAVRIPPRSPSMSAVEASVVRPARVVQRFPVRDDMPVMPEAGRERSGSVLSSVKRSMHGTGPQRGFKEA